MNEATVSRIKDDLAQLVYDRDKVDVSDLKGGPLRAWNAMVDNFVAQVRKKPWASRVAGFNGSFDLDGGYLQPVDKDGEELDVELEVDDTGDIVAA